jgi:ABC-type bacteriocin/lantibiotic exporter with double-glycine peptidase domain
VFSIVVVSLLWAILYFTGSRGLESSLRESTGKYQVAAWLEEMARVVKTIKIATLNGLHLRKTDEATVEYLDARNEHFKILLLQYRTLVAFKTTITAAMLIFGSVLLVNQQLNIGQFIAAEIVILTILNSVEKLIINLDGIYDTLTAVDKLAKLTDKPTEQFGNITLPPSNKGVKIEAKGLCFSYPGRSPIFDNIDFVIQPGQTVCVTGKGGTGKSTLLRLLDGAFADFEGILKIDDIPLRNYELSSLRSHIGIVLHQDDIFAGTLWENITMGKEGIDIKRVVELLDKVGLSSYFASLPQGFDTILDPMGQRLPEQIIHNIMLVRAVAGSPRLLLLEEPWSGMEDSNRGQIINLLAGLKDITTIVVSNDEEFAATCDQVMIMEGDGRLTKTK